MNKVKEKYGHVHDPTEPVEVPSGWEIAPNDYDARQVCGKYNWQVRQLVLGDGKLVCGPWYGDSAGKRRL